MAYTTDRTFSINGHVVSKNGEWEKLDWIIPRAFYFFSAIRF